MSLPSSYHDAISLRRRTEAARVEAGITQASLELFLSFAEDAGNWSGTPLAEVSAAERGNLTQLKRAGLLKTFVDEGDPFVSFTDAGVALAATCGHDLSWIGAAWLA